MPTSIDLNACNFCVWGFKNSYNTFGHVFEAFYRALKFIFPTRQVLWLDEQDDTSDTDFSNTFFIGMHMSLHSLPRRKDCLYAIHNTDQQTKEYLQGFRLLNYGLYVSKIDLPLNCVKLAKDSYFFPQPWDSYDACVFRWGTDLLPHEIETNKPDRVFRKESRVINYVGSIIEETEPFRQACEENGIEFNRIGGFSGTTPVSIEENIRLVEESLLAPAISNAYHCSVGYTPCRFVKNISYGQFGLTNNKACYDLLNTKPIYNPDPRQLFYDGLEKMPEITLQQLYTQMDEVGQNHTYLNKIDVLMAAAKLTLETR